MINLKSVGSKSFKTSLQNIGLMEKSGWETSRTIQRDSQENDYLLKQHFNTSKFSLF